MHGAVLDEHVRLAARIATLHKDALAGLATRKTPRKDLVSSDHLIDGSRSVLIVDAPQIGAATGDLVVAAIDCDVGERYVAGVLYKNLGCHW